MDDRGRAEQCVDHRNWLTACVGSCSDAAPLESNTFVDCEDPTGKASAEIDNPLALAAGRQSRDALFELAEVNTLT